jgi:hypothetical protein
MSFLDQIIDEKTAFNWIEQGTMEWDRIRIGRFTSSQNWRLIVEPKEKSRKISVETENYVMEKVAEVMTGQCKQQGYAFPLVYGTENEPIARGHFIEKTGHKVETVGFFPYTDHAGGSPDGIVNDNAILEIKCPYDSRVMLDYLMLNDQYDLKRDFREHYWQCVNNMIFTGKEFGYFVAFDPRMTKEENKMKVIEITLKEEDQNKVIERLPLAVEAKLKTLQLLQ